MREEIKELEKEVRQERLKFINKVFFNGEPDNVAISTFPERWERFFVGKTDMIKGVHLPQGSDAISCVYHAKENGHFPKHIHKKAEENLFVVMGSVVLYTPNGSTTLTRGMSFKIEAGLGHSAEFTQGTIVIITWLGEGDDFLHFDYDKTNERLPEGCKRSKLSQLKEAHAQMVSDNNVDETKLRKLLEEIDGLENTPCILYTGCHQDCEFFKN